jgi:uncharacterized membrane protein YtjA (UPF0391 family)
MSRWAPAVLVLVLVAGILGTVAIAAPAAALARLLFFVFGLVFLFIVISGFARRT